jgi:hypothetical protein
MSYAAATDSSKLWELHGPRIHTTHDTLQVIFYRQNPKLSSDN